VTFFAQAKKVTRSPEGRVEALLLQRQTKGKELDSGLRRNDELRETKMGLRGVLPRTLRAIRCANVRSGILPPQSGFAGMTSEEEEQRE
jgi:hypothetical protein